MIRFAMGLLAAAAIILHGGWTGDQWRTSSSWLLLARFGLVGVLVYVLAGQVKGARLHIPVDGFTWVGFIALAVCVIGFSGEFVRRVLRREG